MPQCVQNPFKNDVKMAAYGQFVQVIGGGNQLTYPGAEDPIFLHMTTFMKILFTLYKLQITSFEMTKLVKNAFNINPKGTIYMSNRVQHIESRNKSKRESEVVRWISFLS